MSNPATTVELANRWRPLSDQEETNAVLFLDDAWRLLSRKVDSALSKSGALSTVDTLDELMAADAGLTAEVARVICTAVLRVMKNPDGNRQESIDDYSWTRDQAVSAGLLYFTDDELTSILPGVVMSGRAYMVDPLAGRDWTDWS